MVAIIIAVLTAFGQFLRYRQSDEEILAFADHFFRLDHSCYHLFCKSPGVSIVPSVRQYSIT